MARQRGKKRRFTRWELTTKFSALLSKAAEQLQTSTAADAVLIGAVPLAADLILTERGDFLLTEAGAFLET